MYKKGVNFIHKVTVFRYIFCRPMFQKIFRLLFNYSLIGMNLNDGDYIETSGEINVIKLLKKLPRQKFIVFDVGANVGKYSNMVIKDLGNNVNIYCFEPSKVTFEILQNNLGNQTSAKLFNIGLSDNESIIKLYSNKAGTGQASIFIKRLDFWENDSQIRSEEVDLVKLDNFCKDNNITHIDLLKIDVEGNELNVLMGSKQMIETNSIDLIQFEFGMCNIFSRTYLNDFFTILTPRYEIFRILLNGFCRLDKYHSKDEIFISSNYLAVNKELLKKIDSSFLG